MTMIARHWAMPNGSTFDIGPFNASVCHHGDSKRLAYTVYGARGPSERILERLTNAVVGEISKVRDSGRVCLAWCWSPELGPLMVDGPPLDHYDENDLELCKKWRERELIQEGFRAMMRFVLFDQNLNTLQLPEYLIKPAGEAFKELVSAES